MARVRSSRSLQAFLNDRLVGRVYREASGAIHFQYHADWLSDDLAVPVSLSMPLDERRYSGDRVMAVLDNLLPDQSAVRTVVAARVGAAGTDPFSLLEKIGRDCVGALQFMPEGLLPSSEMQLYATPVSDTQIADLLRNLARVPLGLDDSNENAFRISLAGAQEKTALLKHDGKWFRPHGSTPTTHILKPAIGVHPDGLDLSDSVENEFYCLSLLRAFGLTVNNVEIVEFSGERVLVVERFDRQWTSDDRLLRLPQEDMCQALSVPSSRKYQTLGGPGIVDIMSLLTGSDNPIADRRAFFKAQVLFWLIGATDGHAKNYSIRLEPDSRYSLSPLYDVLSLQPHVDRKQLPHKYFKLSMAVGAGSSYRIRDITADHFLETGRKAGLSRKQAQSILTEISESADVALSAVEKQLPENFPVGIHESISAAIALRKVLLAND